MPTKYTSPDNIPDFLEYNGEEFFSYKNVTYQKLEERGSGSFGSVFRCKQIDGEKLHDNNITPKLLALKIELPVKNGKYESGLNFLKGAFINKIFLGLGEFSGIAKNTDKPHYILMHYIEGITLKKIKYLTVFELAPYLIAAAKNIKGFHEYGFVHLDIKPSNLIAQNLQDKNHEPVILIDFDLSEKIPTKILCYDENIRQNSLHLPPELFQSNRHKISVEKNQDFFSFGYAIFDLMRNIESEVCFEHAFQLYVIIQGLQAVEPVCRWTLEKTIFELNAHFISHVEPTILVEKGIYTMFFLSYLNREIQNLNDQLSEYTKLGITFTDPSIINSTKRLRSKKTTLENYANRVCNVNTISSRAVINPKGYCEYLYGVIEQSGESDPEKILQLFTLSNKN